MSSKLGILVILLTVGCQGPKGDPGPQGPAGGTGGNGANGMNGTGGGTGGGTGMTLDGGVPPVAVNCTPATAFCDANRVWTCTRSGADAVLTQDCATVAGTTNNPTTCATTHCAYYQTGGCCRPSKPTCSWSLGGTATMSGTVYGGYGDSAGVYCAAPAALPANCSAGTFSITAYQPHANACPPGNDMVRLDFARGTVTPGQTVTLSAPNNGVTLYEYIGATTCTQWSGTVTWDSDVPHWKVTFNATCTTSNVTMSLNGTMSGDV